MKTAFFTFGSGAGNLAIGASVFNGLRRSGAKTDFTVITDSEFTKLYSDYFKDSENSSFNVMQIKPEPEKLFTEDLNTQLYKVLRQINPELIIVFMLWMPIMPLLEEFNCPKVLLVRQCPPTWLSMQTGPHDSLDVNLQDYNAAFSIEPDFLPDGFSQLPPLILKNPDELPSRKEARMKLQIESGRKCCIMAQNGSPGEFDKIAAEAAARTGGRTNLQDYQIIKTTNRESTAASFFPLIDYLPAADMLVGGAGYNLFYESRMLNISGQFFSFERRAENTQWRIDNNSSYRFIENGADVLAFHLLNL